MAVSGSISTTTFNTNAVIDHAFRRCRLNAQAITSEMQSYAKDNLYLLLSELSNIKTPSWCIEKQIYPLYAGQAQVSLDLGTVDVLNANCRILQEASGVVADSSTSYVVDFTSQIASSVAVVSVGVKWSANSVPLTFETSNDGVSWSSAGSSSATAVSGQWTWTDLPAPINKSYFRVRSVSARLSSKVYLGLSPQEISLGVLNRDDYVAQSNKTFQGRPLSMWFQRNRLNPVINLWPAPNEASEFSQLVVWRHRHIMDVGSLSQEIEVPQRWLEAIVWALASRLAYETPAVDAQLIPALEQKSAVVLQTARDGDNDGSMLKIQPAISSYTA